MGRTTYSDQLKDPRWQKRRLEILSRDEWACQWCGDTSSTLHVHHLYYTRGAEPWDYPDTALLTVCEDCHTNERTRQEDEDYLLIALRDRGVSATMVRGLTNLIDGFFPAPHPRAVMHEVLADALDNLSKRQIDPSDMPF